MARILLAEDDQNMRTFLAKALERAGHEVDAHDDGQNALDALEAVYGPDGRRRENVPARERFDLLLTDIVMPGLDGIELARKAAEIDAGLKIMFITGFAAVALTAGHARPQDDKVLSKPFHLRQLVDEVNRVLAA